MNTKKLYIETMGCAMNNRDSDHLIAELREKEGYVLTDQAQEADLILINTCSVREKPERKLFSEIGQFNAIKKPHAKIGVCGCTASHLGEEIIKKAPSVSFVLGARNISKITQVIHQDKAVEVDTNFDDSTYMFSKNTNPDIKALLNISIGCDKKCTYCIVPHTRGKEISIPTQMLLDEAQKLAQNGVKELLLLGQNVNHYGTRFSNPHKPTNFTQLLRELSQIEGIERIRFTSPHPLHMDDEFLEEFASNPKICKSIHIPLQSGSTKVLREMKRGYTQEWYLDRVQKLKSLVPHVGISTDIIVAFPTETEEDFEETMKVLNLVQFDTLYSFIYSPRPHTEAQNLHNPISKEEASKRLATLQARHKEILAQKAKQEIGSIHSVLIENHRDQSPYIWSEGRSDTNRLIKIPDQVLPLGSIVSIKVTHHEGGSLSGELLS
ncbi:tRNA (N6-isopentenyl adenosine(37)-C2)-methylthiotransferase MiaB [Helicobacter pametensis]|uniref:tRNA (N6-isopentenyl adenosine(37)-C2)-methylthiotransferase MiaB n=1 Tax=Helicobacter pametensis TaxID=95149 RepID=UPI0004850DA4|nr:tRNA (N6-isopentenyl adenosine(37)-C2)-methylthiotransferase MiaB [Helicobacter pametensis]